MTKPARLIAAALGAAALIIISAWLDRLSGSIVRVDAVGHVARVLSMSGNGAFLIPAALAIAVIGHVFKDHPLRGAGISGLFAIIVSGAAANVLKSVFERPRVFQDHEPVLALLNSPALLDISGKFSSFPSGHTTASFALAFVMAKSFPRLSVPIYSVAALIGVSRVYVGAHYPSDVAAGALLGLLCGWLVMERSLNWKRWLFAGLMLLAVAISFFKSGGFLLFDIDEAVFSEASREMAETNDFITPTYDYDPRYDKPILFYWLASTSMRVFGVSEFAARLPSAAFGVLLVAMTFFFIKRIRGELAAFIVSLVLLLNIEFFVYSHSAVTDMTLAFFITASVYSAYLAIIEKRPLWHDLFWAAGALAVLTKGVIGLLFPAATVLIFLLLSKRHALIWGFLKPYRIGLFLLIAVPWFAAEFYVNGWEFFNAFIIKHHIQRYSGIISSHGGPPYFYLAVLLIGFFPWVTMLPGALIRGFKDRLSKENGLFLLSSVWLVFIFIFFSIAKTKLPNYIFPAFPAASILAGLSICGLIEENRHRTGAAAMALLSLLLAAASFAFPSLGIKAEVAFQPVFFYSMGVIFAVVAVFSAASLKRPMPSFLLVCAGVAALIIFLRLNALPPVNLRLQKTLYDYSVYSRSLGTEAVLATYEINKPSVAFYARRKVLRVEKRAQCDIRENAKKTDILVITSPSRLDELKELNLKIIDNGGDYVLLGNSDRLPAFKGGY